MNVRNCPFSESIVKIHVIWKVEAIDIWFFVIFYLDTFIFQIHSYLYAQAGVCGIISQRDLNEIWVWWSNIRK